MKSGMQRALRRTLLAAIAGLVAAACTVPSPCDPGWTHDHGTCTPPPVEEPDSGPGDGDGDGDGDEDAGVDSDAAVDAAVVDPVSEFICPAGGDRSAYGRDCTTHADCDCPAAVCITSLGYCTGTQCNEPGKECPEGMTCIDIAPFRDQASFDVPDEITHVCL